MTKAKPSRKNWVEEADAADTAVEAFFEPMSDAEIDALMEDKEFLEWLDEALEEAERNTEPSISSEEMRQRIDEMFADARRQHPR